MYASYSKISNHSFEHIKDNKINNKKAVILLMKNNDTVSYTHLTLPTTEAV